jgi:predicted DNA-binding transcriptional regulator YafY
MTHNLSPTARALLAFEVIQNRPGLTGHELAARLGVTDRAARRYVGILREAGIPVDSVSGRYSGYSVGRGAQVPPLMFSTAEALGLVVALLRGWHGSIDTSDPAATALAKILRVLPDAAAAPAEALRRVVAQNPSDAEPLARATRLAETWTPYGDVRYVDSTATTRDFLACSPACAGSSSTTWRAEHCQPSTCAPAPTA